MAESSPDVTAHYSFGGLRDRIADGISRLGAEPSVETLGSVDEFHVGGRPATKHLVGQLSLSETDHVLDLGSGLGGTARFIASTTGASVTGIDLTSEYVEVATWLSGLVGLSEQVSFVVGSATDLSTIDRHFAQHFDAATMVHVGMNIDDKATLCSQVAGVLKPGGLFGIYDVMAVAEGAASQISYPVPWAASNATSRLESAATYQSHLEDAGFEIVALNNRLSNALAAVEQPAATPSKGPSPLGLHLVMGPETSTKIANMVAGFRSGLLAPTEIVARRLAS